MSGLSRADSACEGPVRMQMPLAFPGQQQQPMMMMVPMNSAAVQQEQQELVARMIASTEAVEWKQSNSHYLLMPTSKFVWFDPTTGQTMGPFAWNPEISGAITKNAKSYFQVPQNVLDDKKFTAEAFFSDASKMLEKGPAGHVEFCSAYPEFPQALSSTDLFSAGLQPEVASAMYAEEQAFAAQQQQQLLPPQMQPFYNY